MRKLLLDREVPTAIKLQQNKRAFLEFSLCLSRACLGKIIIFVCKWLKKPNVFSPAAGNHRDQHAALNGNLGPVQADDCVEVDPTRAHNKQLRNTARTTETQCE